MWTKKQYEEEVKRVAKVQKDSGAFAVKRDQAIAKEAKKYADKFGVKIKVDKK